MSQVWQNKGGDGLALGFPPLDTMDTNNLNNLIKQLLMVGVGTTSAVADKLKEVSEQWVQDGRWNQDQAKAFVDEMMQQLRLDSPNREAQWQRYMQQLLQDLGVPRQAEVDELRGRIDRLERKLRDLENKLWESQR
jgi:polyhydroxyalkanoate synthesis regulator phasin